MSKAKVVVSYDDNIPTEFFNDFLADSHDAGTATELIRRPSDPTMGIEWLLPTAIIVFLGKPFIDDILKRAAKDVGDYIYPKLRSTISSLATKALQSSKLKRVTTSGHVIQRKGRSGFFSITSESKSKIEVKFVLEEGRSAVENDLAVDKALLVLVEHYLGDKHDSLAAAPIEWGRTIFMGFDYEKQEWIPLDVLEEIKKEHLKSIQI